MRYEFEDYKTKIREVVNTKEEAIINVHELLSNISGGGTLNLIIDELIFASYFINNKFKVYRLPLSLRNLSSKYLFIGKNLGIEEGALFEVGVPDFLVHDLIKNEFVFVEVKKDDENRKDKSKKSEFSLNENQIKWAKKHSSAKLLIARLKPFDEEGE